MNCPSLPSSDSTPGVGIGVGAGVGLGDGDGDGVIFGDGVATGAGPRDGGTAATGVGVAACRASPPTMATTTRSATSPADNASLGRRRTDCQAPLESVMAGRYHPALHQTPRTMVPLAPGSRARPPLAGSPPWPRTCRRRRAGQVRGGPFAGDGRTVGTGPGRDRAPRSRPGPPPWNPGRQPGSA